MGAGRPGRGDFADAGDTEAEEAACQWPPLVCRIAWAVMTTWGWPAADARAGCRRRRLGLAAVLLVAFGLGSERDEAEAYRLYDNGARDYIVGSDQAIRWSPEAWGPGSTLAWRIEDGPDYALLQGLVDSAEDFAPLFEQALALWAAIPTADISWRFRGMEERSEESRFGDSRSSVFFDPESEIWGAAAWWIRNHSHGAWEIAECDIGIFPLHEEEWWDADLVKDWMPAFFAEELGQCLGLGKPAVFAASRRLRVSSSGEDFDWRRSALWSPIPAMAGGESPASLAPDDRVGASLLRPRAGWVETTGSLSGVLKSDGEPVAYAHVWALRRSNNNRMRDLVGAFANAEGEFRIEGLPPGDYALWAHPIRRRWNQRPLIENGANTDLKDVVLAHPVRVAAGRVTDGIVIPMRRGRE